MVNIILITLALIDRCGNPVHMLCMFGMHYNNKILKQRMKAVKRNPIMEPGIPCHMIYHIIMLYPRALSIPFIAFTLELPKDSFIFG